MEFYHLLVSFKKHVFVALMTGLFAASADAASHSLIASNHRNLLLRDQPGFFRFSFDNVKMPQHIQSMGLMGINYFANLGPVIYGGMGAYGSISGTQGGFFTLGAELGAHYQFAPHWWGDMGMFAGGGGGRSSLVGGGLMLRPHIGLAYDFQWARLGLHYSYIDFPSGQIRSQQLGLDLDIPYDFYYVRFQDLNDCLFNADAIHLFNGKFLDLQRNDFAILLQAYRQQPGTKNVNGVVQDGTIGVIGAELDHYISEHGFWYLKAGGAFRGIPNGYMDIMGGLGYHFALRPHSIALIPQLGVGAGGGGNVNTGGGVLVQPQLGIELPLTSDFATRISGGYLWSPKGNLRAYTATGMLIYHLDVATGSAKPINHLLDALAMQGWRMQLFNQTYLHPQRTYTSATSAINQVGLQIDQMINPLFFFSYQAAAAYSGKNAGGLATGMIGPGMQTPKFLNQHLQLFLEFLVGAGGGGSLALAGGSLIEPVLGLHYAFTPSVGLSASVSQIKALHHDLNTPVFNVGLTISFATLDRK